MTYPKKTVINPIETGFVAIEAGLVGAALTAKGLDIRLQASAYK